jgi:hypothetical protein
MADLKPSAFAIAGGSAVVGGVVGAVLTLALAPPRPETGVRAEAAPAQQVGDGALLEGRVAALESSFRALQRARATVNPPSASTSTGAPSPAATDAPPAADVGPIVDNPVFEAAVRDVLERAEHERNMEREAQRAEWRKQAADEWANDMTEKLRLTELQKAQALSIASNFWEKLRDLRQGDAGANLGRQEWRARLDELRAAAESELAKALSPAQMSTYRELDESSRLGSRRSLRASERAGRRSD